MQATGLIIGGKVVPCSQPVYNWNDHGLKFKLGKGTRKRTGPIDLFINHYSAGEGSYKTLFNVLESRGLSCDFCIDAQGNIYQFSDPLELVTFHAGDQNNRAIGVEITSYGYRSNASDIPSAGRNRKTHEATIHDKKLKMASFYEVQHKAALALNLAVCGALSIPKVMPTKDGLKVTGDVLTDKQLKNFSGIIGHLHCSDKKIDPSIEIFDYFYSNGIKLEQV